MNTNMHACLHQCACLCSGVVYPLPPTPRLQPPLGVPYAVGCGLVALGLGLLTERGSDSVTGGMNSILTVGFVGMVLALFGIPPFLPQAPP